MSRARCSTEGAGALCVATVAEALELRAEFSLARILVMGPTSSSREVAEAREAKLELAVWSDEIPEGVRVHLKLDTGMGRWGLGELPKPPAEVVGLMSHLATADSDPAFAEQQVERFREATEPYADLMRHVANSAAALRLPAARFDAARCGVALYGLSPFGEDPGADGLEPALSWRSYLAQVKRLEPGESSGYGRRFVAERPTWIGIVPVGYGDGFRRDLTGTEVRVGGELRRVVGTVSMDAFAVELDGEEPVGAPVTILGHGVLAEDHARVAGTINYELVCGTNSDPRRGAADGGRWLRPRRRCWPGRRPGSSAARCATSCSDGSWSISTSPAAIRSGPPVPTPSASAVRPFRSRSGTALGGSRSRAAALSTSRRCPARSRTTWPRATSRSTRSPGRSLAGSRSTPSAGRPIWRSGGCARSARASFATTRCGCCARCGSKTSSTCAWTTRPRALVREHAALVGAPAGERILAELRRLSSAGYRRLDGLGLLEPLGGRIDDRLERWDSPDYRLAAVFGDELRRYPVSNALQRYAATLLRAEPPEDDPRSIHRFRRATEPWALEALAFLGAPELAPAIERARSGDPAEPLVRGDELGLPPGPEIGRLLAEIEEERAVGTIATKEEALDYARRHSGAVREDG